MNGKTLGIVLAGGTSTRLYPTTFTTTKQLLGVYDKPLIYYPIDTLLRSNIRELVVICKPEEYDRFQNLFKESGLGWIHVLCQPKPVGIPDVFNIIKKEGYDDYERYSLILGDNIFIGSDFQHEWGPRTMLSGVAVAYCKKIPNMERFGVVIEKEDYSIELVEKPNFPLGKNSKAILGAYNFPNDVFERVKNLKVSHRGIIEIVDLLQMYLDDMKMIFEEVDDVLWYDTGTPDSFLDASNLVRQIQTNTGELIGSPHYTIVKRNLNLLRKEQLEFFLTKIPNTDYASKLKKIINENYGE